MFYRTPFHPLFWPIILFLGLAFASCSFDTPYFSLNQEEGGYQWTSGPSIENEEQYLAYQHKGTFMLAKNSVSLGLQPLKKIIAVSQTQFTDMQGRTTACLAYKEGNNYDGPWEVITYKGETVLSANAGLTFLPAKIVQEADTLRFVR